MTKPDVFQAARLKRNRATITTAGLEVKLCVGHGVALPHPRKPPKHLFAEPVISVCFPDVPLDWAALDGEPVSCVMLLLSPSAPVHLQILSRVAFALRSPEFRTAEGLGQGFGGHGYSVS